MWYGRPSRDPLPPVGTTMRNVYGVADLHGLIWEWTLDFNSALVTGESRADASLERTLYCGSGAVGAADFEDYAAFMRYAFRSSLEAHYGVPNLGFRGVRNRAATAR
jgi:formylglycine-generating enzyme required for sulfatase activity